MRTVLSGVRLRHNDVAYLAGIRPRCHFIQTIGEMRRTHPSKVGVGLVHGRIGEVIIGAVDGTEVEGIWAVTAAQALTIVGKPDVALIDLRERSERERHGTIPGSLHVPYPALQENISDGGMLHELVKSTNKRLLFYCAFGERSAMAVQAAQDAGLSSACHIQGGIDAWKKASGPLSH